MNGHVSQSGVGILHFLFTFSPILIDRTIFDLFFRGRVNRGHFCLFVFFGPLILFFSLAMGIKVCGFDECVWQLNENAR